MERVLNLKEHLDLLPQYVELRNNYCKLLLTQTVGITESIYWIQNTTAEIRVIEEENCLLGVVLLYLDRAGEVAFFARKQNRGIGTRLLEVVDAVAIQAKLSLIWAWVRDDNPIAAKVFEKCGYIASSTEKRNYEGQLVKGTRYIKSSFEKVLL